LIITNKIQSLQGIDFTEGHVILIDKSLTWTSFDVVNKIRYMIRKKYNIKKIKVGHGGTLDPLASGVVVIGVAKETKRLADYQNETKEYIAEVTFGHITASYDLETELEGNYETSHITASLIETTLNEKFTGTIDQLPPIFSAKSIDGVRAYQAAREGKALEMRTQQVTIYSSKLLAYSNCKAQISIECSKGTYIRSIAYDLGKELQSGAHLSALQRTKSGGFNIDNCLQLADFENLIDQMHI
jgi:tRNA pseudouridine55 synthase